MSLSRENQQMDAVQEKVSLESKGIKKNGDQGREGSSIKKSEAKEEDKQRKEDLHAVVKQSQSVSLPKQVRKRMLLAILGAVSLFFTVLIMSILKKRND